MANQRLNATITIGAAVSATLGRTVAAINSQLGSIGERGGFAAGQRRIGDAIARNSAALNDARMGLVDSIGTFYALREAIGAPIEAAAGFETMLEDIGQKAGIPVRELGALGEQIKQVARDTNQGAMDIGAAVDALVGRGASVDVALAAADPIGEAAVAYRAATDDLAAASWAAVDNLKVPADQIEAALDAMAQAGKEGAFELRDMASYFPGLGAAYQGLGQDGVDAVADLAAALQVVRKGTGDASTAATNLQNVLQKIYAPGTVKKFGEAGVDIFAEMEKAAKRGLTPIEAIAEITEKTLKGDLSKMGDLFEDAQVQAGLRSLIQGMEEYRRIRDEAMTADGVLSEDYARRIKTAAGAQKRWAASIENLSITFGTSLLPVLNDTLDAIVPIIGAVGEWIAANPQLAATLTTAVGGVLAFKAALAGIRFLGLVGKGGALDLLALGMNTVGRAGARLGGAAREAIALQAALGAMDGKTMTGLQRLGTGLGAAVRAVPGVGLLAQGIAAIGGAVATISAPVWGAFALAAVAIGSAGALIWKYWDRITGVLAGVAARVGEELQPVLEKIRPVLDWFAPLGDVIAAGWGKAAAAVGAVVGWLGGLFGQEQLTEEQKAAWEKSGYDLADRLIKGVKEIPARIKEIGAELYTIGAEIVQSLWDGMQSVFDSLIAWVGQKVDQVLKPFRDARAYVGGLFSSGGGDTGGDGQTAGAPPQRAVGGYFGRGPVLVGERGPELRFEDRAGYIATNRRLREMARNAAIPAAAAAVMSGALPAAAANVPAASAPSQTVVDVGGIQIFAQPGQDARQIADEVLRVLQDRSRAAMYDRG